MTNTTAVISIPDSGGCISRFRCLRCRRARWRCRNGFHKHRTGWNSSIPAARKPRLKSATPGRCGSGSGIFPGVFRGSARPPHSPTRHLQGEPRFWGPVGSGSVKRTTEHSASLTIRIRSASTPRKGRVWWSPPTAWMVRRSAFRTTASGTGRCSSCFSVSRFAPHSTTR